MENELEVMRGQILGLAGALNVIAAVLPDGMSQHAAEVLSDMVAATRDSGLPSVVTESMHSTMLQIKKALQVSLSQTETAAAG